MDLSLFLAKLFGLYFTIIGVSALVKREALAKGLKVFMKDTATWYFFAVVELAAGLVLVLNHNIWDGTWRTLVTIVGWVILIEGLIYLILPQRATNKLLAAFGTTGWIVTGGIISLVIGLFLIFQSGLV